MLCPRCDFPNDSGFNKCFICGYMFLEDVPMLNLPEIDYNGWTIPMQIRKIGEEIGEVGEAVAEENPVQVIRESLDAIQTLHTLITMVSKEYNLGLSRFYREHIEKLERKGYLKRGDGA